MTRVARPNIAAPFLIALVLGLGPAHVRGQWSQEPESVFGIKLGAKVEELNLPACVPTPLGAPPMVGPCFDPTLNPWPSSNLKLLGWPVLGVPYSADVSLFEGRVSAIWLQLPQDSFDQMSEILVVRYGRPQVSSTEKLANLAGAVLPSRRLMWVGKKMTIIATERAGRVDRSSVMFSSNELTNRQSDVERTKNKGAASKL